MKILVLQVARQLPLKHPVEYVATTTWTQSKENLGHPGFWGT